MLEIEFLGTGTSCGVPSIGCHCAVCQSSDPRDKRLRTSAIVRYKGKSLLIDCGPDFRQQVLRASSQALDALLLTHIHYDHVAGIDDLRPYSYKHSFPVYARQDVIDRLHLTMPYAFGTHLYPGVPKLDLVPIADAPFMIGNVAVEPIPVMHDKLRITGFRIGPLAYITDCKTLPPAQVERLHGTPMLVINALRWHKPHHSHLSIEESLELVRRIEPGRALFIHMSHEAGFHSVTCQKLPRNVDLAYDTQIVRVP